MSNEPAHVAGNGEANAIEGLALAAFEAMDAAVFITDGNGTIEWVNNGFTALTGWSAIEACGQTPRILRSGLQDEQYYRRFWSAITSGQPTRTHVLNRKRSGEFYSAVQHVTPVIGPDGVPHHFVAIQEPLADDELPAFDQLSVAVIATDTTGRVRVWNRAAELLLGWEAAKMRGTPLIDGVVAEAGQDEAAAVLERAVAGGSWQGEFPIRRRDGTTFSARVQVAPQRDSNGVITGLIGAAVDITEELKLREAVAQTARLEATGRLAAAVAHDFNNILTAISLHASMAAEELAAEHPTRTDLKQIERAAERAATLTRRLLAFSRSQPATPSAVDLNELLRQLEPLLAHVVREDIALAYELGEALKPVWADPAQVEQIVVNLVVNARDAMPRGGSVVIRTSADAGAQDFVTLEVSDTGTGIAPEVQERMFEPFFTTKGAEGTGLGLATVSNIVAQSGGHVGVTSEEGRGASFRVALPTAHEPAPVRTGNVDGGRPATPTLSGKTALVIDDDRAVRDLVVRALRSQGMTVLAASTPWDALRMAHERGDGIGLVVADVVLPGMNGMGVVAALKSASVRAPALFISGYMPDREMEHTVPSDRLLRKPFTTNDLLSAAERALAGAAPG